MINTGLCLTGPMDGKKYAVHDTNVFSVDMSPPVRIGRANSPKPTKETISRFDYRLLRFEDSINFWVPSGWTHIQVIKHLAKNYRS